MEYHWPTLTAKFARIWRFFGSAWKFLRQRMEISSAAYGNFFGSARKFFRQRTEIFSAAHENFFGSARRFLRQSKEEEFRIF